MNSVTDEEERYSVNIFSNVFNEVQNHINLEKPKWKENLYFD